jgi:hypothetical protein
MSRLWMRFYPARVHRNQHARLLGQTDGADVIAHLKSLPSLERVERGSVRL